MDNSELLNIAQLIEQGDTDTLESQTYETLHEILKFASYETISNISDETVSPEIIEEIIAIGDNFLTEGCLLNDYIDEETIVRVYNTISVAEDVQLNLISSIAANIVTPVAILREIFEKYHEDDEDIVIALVSNINLPVDLLEIFSRDEDEYIRNVAIKHLSKN